jgi:predicted  nucleic acid-binding Zn-ribbon protein
VREKLVALAKLAEMDLTAREYDLELRAIPERLDGLRSDVSKLEALLAEERRRLNEAETLRSRADGDLAERNDALARTKAKMAKARNAKEADAAQREADTNRQAIKDREAEVARIAASLQEKRAALTERERQFEEARAALAEEEKTAAVRVEELRAIRAKTLVGREDFVALVPPAVLKRYERVAGAKGYGVVVIDTETCVGCRITLPAQMYIEIQRSNDFIDCPACKRIIIHRSALLDV